MILGNALHLEGKELNARFYIDSNTISRRCCILNGGSFSVLLSVPIQIRLRALKLLNAE